MFDSRELFLPFSLSFSLFSVSLFLFFFTKSKSSNANIFEFDTHKHHQQGSQRERTTMRTMFFTFFFLESRNRTALKKSKSKESSREKKCSPLHRMKILEWDESPKNCLFLFAISSIIIFFSWSFHFHSIQRSMVIYGHSGFQFCYGKKKFADKISCVFLKFIIGNLGNRRPQQSTNRSTKKA